LLCKNTPADIGEKILALKNDPVKREQIATRGYDKIRTGYNHLAIGKKLVEMAEKLLHS
jgi:spore maturation protein CgeB